MVMVGVGCCGFVVCWFCCCGCVRCWFVGGWLGGCDHRWVVVWIRCWLGAAGCVVGVFHALVVVLGGGSCCCDGYWWCGVDCFCVWCWYVERVWLDLVVVVVCVCDVDDCACLVLVC